MLNICHPVLAVTLALLTGAVSSRAVAQPVPPPPVPQLPDEPLPEWRPPARRPLDVVHLDIALEAERAQALRQAGLWFASFGGASMLASGILYAYAKDLNDSLSHPRVDFGSGDNGTYYANANGGFDPTLEDRRDAAQAASFSLLVIGAASMVAGFTLFAVGQAKLRDHHNKYPKDPLPPLSGYDR